MELEQSAQSVAERKSKDMGRKTWYPNTRQLKDGRWQFRKQVEGVQISVYGDSQKEAYDKGIEKIKQVQEGTYKANTVITLNEYFNEWIESKLGTVSEKTIYDYERMWENHVKPTELGRRKVQKVERLELINFRNKLAKERTKKTANHVLMVISTLLKSAVMNEIIVKNPAANIPRLKDKAGKPARETIHRALTPQEIKIFMEFAQKTLYYNAFRLMLATGIRAGECGALEWGDIDYKKGVIHIRRTVTRNRKGENFISDRPKTKTSIRDIPLNNEIQQIIEAQRNFYNKIHGEYIRPLHATIFESSGRKFVSSGNFQSAINWILKKINRDGQSHIKHFGCHAFRDTFATMAIMNGMQPNTLKEILGHASLSMTMDLYAHVLDSEKKKAMENLRVIPI